ncbi:MAG: hypothetical protein J5966_05845, partial [Lachnospiraceae bacterium]|nr:hypothetical protein [Lachnospiraceae bacterium]
MGALDTITGSIAQNTGNIEKAVIEVIDMRNRNVNNQPAVNIVGGQGGAGGAGGGGNVLANGANALKKTRGFADKSLLRNEHTDYAQTDDQHLENIINSHTKVFVVQFNPSTLQLSGTSGEYVQKVDFSNNVRQDEASYAPSETTINLSVSLLFDACDPQDAFMGDKLSLASPTGAATGIAKTAMAATGNKKNSVQKEVEGFIGALRNRYTRLVTFHWGNISYSGILKGVEAQYTMFSVTGEPVRATVDMNIMCAHSTMYPNSLAVWQGRYKNAFGKGSESFVKTSAKFGKIL